METSKLTVRENEKKTITLESDLEITVLPFADCTLIVNVEKAMTASLHVVLEEGSRLVIFFQNSSPDYQVSEVYDVRENAELRVAYCELESRKLARNTVVNLAGAEARVELISGAFADSEKKMDIICDHLVPHTSSNMKTYGVVLNEGNYAVRANGKIERGAYGSKTHQTSRVLTFADKQRAKIEPLLMIDENDVEASHATSIGQLDENQLYYLMSRGITKSEALKLISLGYLYPLTDVTSDAQLREYLTKLIEKKVAEACLM